MEMETAPAAAEAGFPWLYLALALVAGVVVGAGVIVVARRS